MNEKHLAKTVARQLELEHRKISVRSRFWTMHNELRSARLQEMWVESRSSLDFEEWLDLFQDEELFALDEVLKQVVAFAIGIDEGLPREVVLRWVQG
jgi:hypothetical protein